MKWLALVVVCGCGRINFEATSDAMTGFADADTSCWPLYHDGTVQFGTPTPISEVNTAIVENNPYLASDGRHLYFNRGMTGARDIYLAIRPEPDEPFAPPAALTTINSPADDARLAVVADGSLGVLASMRPGGVGNFDLYSVVSTDGGTTFAAPTMMIVGNVNSAAFEGSPEISEDGLRLYFSFVLGMTPSTLYVVERADTNATFDNPVLLPGFDTSVFYSDLALSPDERVALVTINNTTTDVYYLTRATRTDSFGNPTAIADLNVPNTNDDDPTVSFDGCEVIMASSRTGNPELYRATVLR